MLSISYTVSTQINENLEKIETLSRAVLSTPLSRESEATLQYEALLEKLKYYLSLDHYQLRKKEIHEILGKESARSTSNSKRRKPDEELLAIYKKITEQITTNWIVTPRQLKPADIITLAQDLRMKRQNKVLDDLLSYLSIQHDSPLFQAGIATTQITSLNLLPRHNESFGMLMGSLYLAKSGLDCRQYVSMERQYRLSPGSFFNAYQNGVKNANQTIWLEYYTGAYVEELNTVLLHIKTLRHNDGWDERLPTEEQLPIMKELRAGIHLTKRQKAILSLFVSPDIMLTNRDVQKQFGISQITASRDLAGLRTVGLLFSHGNGRSIYYTKV